MFHKTIQKKNSGSIELKVIADGDKMQVKIRAVHLCNKHTFFPKPMVWQWS